MYTFNCKSRLTTPLFSSPWTTKYPRYIQLHSVASTCAGHQAAWFPHQASFPYIPQPGCPLFLLFCSLHLQFLTMTLTCVRHRVAWCSSKASFPYIPQPECTSCSQPTYWSIPHTTCSQLLSPQTSVKICSILLTILCSLSLSSVSTNKSETNQNFKR